MSHPQGIPTMNHKFDDSIQGRGSPEIGYAAERSASLSSASTRTPPSTPATSRTEPTISRPRPPRRHTDKPTLHRLPSTRFSPAFTKKSPVFGHTGPCATPDPYTERAYMSQALHDQNERAKRLLARLASAEERLLLDQECHAPGERRKLRKNISLLKKEMAKNAEQERATLLRLGDLYVEIQQRERWMQLQQQRISALMALQQQQQLFYPRVFAGPIVVNPQGSEGDVAVSSSPVEQTAQIPEEACPPPPPPPPPTAVPWFNSFPPLSPTTSSCLSPLSPSFRPGEPFQMNGLFSSRHRDSSPLGKHGDGNDPPERDTREKEDRGRSHVPASPTPTRTTSVPRPDSCDRARGRRRDSVPATSRIAWADEVALEEA
ncbi:hypothetical protein GE09DRAFT_659165 [Coniochaeta sp. 2T2.1]|nr:hypothetical protein GE09DRAFT_659165 [Coniochaeta sp. 2T2.1]